MSNGATADGPPPDSRDEIMDATYCALCDQGYANLTMADIATELGKSTSLLHYHYDTKRDLLAAFLAYIVEEYNEKLAAQEDVDPLQRLQSILDMFVFGAEDEERRQFHLAVLELRAQVPHVDAYREPFLRSEESVRQALADAIRAGIDQDVFAEADPEKTAALVFAAMDGARARQITLGIEDYTETVRNELLERLVVDAVSDDRETDE